MINSTRRMVGGVRMSEFAMSQAFFEFGGEKRLARLSAVGHEIERIRTNHVAGALEGTNGGWESCIALVNGRAYECHRIGEYTIIVHGGDVLRLSRMKRVALWLSAPIMQIAKVLHWKGWL